MKAKLAVALAAVLLMNGCVSTKQPNFKEAFLERRPEDRDKYIRLDQCSPDMYEYFVQRQRGALMGLLNAFQRVAEKKNDAGSLKFVDEQRASVNAANQNERKLINDIRSAFDPTTDSLFYYSFDHGNKLEQGWMIIRNAEIKQKLGVLEMEINIANEGVKR